MGILNKWRCLFFLFIFPGPSLWAQSSSDLRNEVLSAMMKATRFMADSVSTNGGYLSHYLPDFSRRWGEMEAYPTMVWVQYPGTVSMGNTFLDAWFATHEEYYYDQAKRVANALIWGQLPSGGWNYFIDFGGLNSTLKWYHTIGRNGWRLEEFQHYYGNATFDDETTSGAALFLLRLYLVRLDPDIKTSLDKAIAFVLKSQYPQGGWPQRYPLRRDFVNHGEPDYTSFYTFNDNVQWQNIKFLIACYATLNDQGQYFTGGGNALLDAIRRGMNFFLLTQGPRPHAGWGEQYTMNLKPAGARTYEPPSLDPQYTAANIEILLKFYQMTGDRRFLQRIPDAINWLKKVKIRNTDKEGVYIYPMFTDIETNKPLYTHRVGSNVISGHYYVDDDSTNTIGHYSNFRSINLKKIEEDYQRMASKRPAEVVQYSPIFPGTLETGSLSRRYDEVIRYLKSSGNHPYKKDTKIKRLKENKVRSVIRSLDNRGRWLVSGLYTSHPYKGTPGSVHAHTKKYRTTFVGDEYDTSPFRDTSDQKYISTAVYTRNMELLIDYLKNGGNKKE